MRQKEAWCGLVCDCIFKVFLQQDVAGIKGSVTGRVNSWTGKPAEGEKTVAPAPAAAAPAPAPSAAAKPAPAAAAKPAVRPDKSLP